jgi:hypothetical protein
MLEFNGTLKLQEILEGEGGRLVEEKRFLFNSYNLPKRCCFGKCGNPNFSQKGHRFGLYFNMLFFLQEGILVTYQLQNDVVLIFPSIFTIY